MPAGKGRYTIGAKGTHGCEGYPVVGGEGKVHGCHATEEAARAQQAAIYASEAASEKNLDKADPCWEGYVMRGMKPGENGSRVPNCVPVAKADRPIQEGDYVMGGTSEGIVVGQVEHIMTEGGVYGTPGTEYAIESTPENPAMAVRMFEQEEDGKFCPTAYSIGMLYNDAIIVDIEIAEEDQDEMEKAEGYSPPAGARAAARRAIKFKEDGKATGAGTAVGWTRARQLANGETLSLSTVKRMYSYFSRHEVDKKGKDWGNQANPSNGYIMWLAWGGDAGYSWSRNIVNRMKDKSLFAEFGKDYTKAQPLTEIFDKSFGYPSTNNPLPAKHSGPNTAPAGVENYPKSTQNTLTNPVK